MNGLYTYDPLSSGGYNKKSQDFYNRLLRDSDKRSNSGFKEQGFTLNLLLRGGFSKKSNFYHPFLRGGFQLPSTGDDTLACI